MRTRLIYHAACKVEFQPFKRLSSQLTFFNFLQNLCVGTSPQNMGTAPKKMVTTPLSRPLVTLRLRSSRPGDPRFLLFVFFFIFVSAYFFFSTPLFVCVPTTRGVLPSRQQFWRILFLNDGAPQPKIRKKWCASTVARVTSYQVHIIRAKRVSNCYLVHPTKKKMCAFVRVFD